MTRTVWTVGHSNRSIAALLELLRSNRIERVVDVRRFPSSRRHPHFSRGPLSAALDGAGVAYVHVEALGGHREVDPASPHAALAEPAFRAYADHMTSASFGEAFRRLLDQANADRTAVMCAEADWRHCHRGLLADRLVAEGVRVLHIDANGASEHALHSAARFAEGRLTYRGAKQLGFADWAD